MAWNVGKKREKKYNTKDGTMEVKQYGKAQYGTAQADAAQAAKAAQEKGKTRTTQEKVKQFYNSAAGKKIQDAYDTLTSKKASSESKTEKKKPASERYKEISERAASKRTAEQNAAIEKNNNRLYWKNKERANNSGSYKAMMQSRTKGEMQRAANKNAKTAADSDWQKKQRDNSSGYKASMQKKTEEARRKAMEKAFGR